MMRRLFDPLTWRKFFGGSGVGIGTEPGDVARAAFESAHPGHEVSEVRHQGREESKHCIAIIYETPLPSRPLPYKLYAVNGGVASEVDIMRHPRFALKARR
ncbi:MAG: hypothetical protein ACO1TE_19510 [Prosthecobacter sp.]